MTTWQILVSIIFTWTGFVCAISFMEAWLKFRAPGVTLPVGLSIGRLIFKTLNKVEWLLALLSLLLLYLKLVYQTDNTIWLLLAVFILLIQTIWLLPAMDKRAAQVIAGEDLPRSTLHFFYVGAELLKVTALLMFGSNLLAMPQ